MRIKISRRQNFVLTVLWYPGHGQPQSNFVYFRVSSQEFDFLVKGFTVLIFRFLEGVELFLRLFL